MKIQAKIPFTYLYPEEEPSGEVDLVKLTATTVAETPGSDASFLIEDNLLIWQKLLASGTNEVTVIFDGERYENVPIADRILGSTANYPFAVDRSNVDPYFYTTVEGEHTIEIIPEAYVLPVVITNGDTVVSTWEMGVFKIGADNIAEMEQINVAAGATKTENVYAWRYRTDGGDLYLVCLLDFGDVESETLFLGGSIVYAMDEISSAAMTVTSGSPM